MDIVLGICLLVLIACLVGLLGCSYMRQRLDKVTAFGSKLIDMAHDYNVRRIVEGELNYSDALDWFFGKWTFEQMLYSIKPLKLEAWFTEEELKEINR